MLPTKSSCLKIGPYLWLVQFIPVSSLGSSNSNLHHRGLFFLSVYIHDIMSPASTNLFLNNLFKPYWEPGDCFYLKHAHEQGYWAAGGVCKDHAAIRLFLFLCETGRTEQFSMQ